MERRRKSGSKRVTVYFDPETHRALRFKAAASEKSLSELVNRAVELSLAEDLKDRVAFERRRKEPGLGFESFLRDLKRRGKL